MKKIKKIFVQYLLAAALVAGFAGMSTAAKPHDRDGWLLGMGYGMSYGEVTFVTDIVGDTKDGVTPQVRFGHMVGKHFSASVEYNGWVYETGQLPDKYRVSLQQVMAALTWYPGNSESHSGGLYVRASCGLGWSGFAMVELDDDLIQGEGGRIDETGLGLAMALGYELRIARDVAAGLSFGYNYLDINGDLFNEAYFTPLTFSLNWYWH